MEKFKAFLANNKVLTGIILFIAIAVTLWLIFRNKNNTNSLPITTPSNNANTGSNAPAPDSDAFPIKKGSRGDNVRRLQVALNFIDPSDSITEDGVWGTKTNNKVLTTLATTEYGDGPSLTEQQLNFAIAKGNKIKTGK